MGPTQRNKDGLCIRIDNQIDGRSAGRLGDPRDTPWYTRLSFSKFAEVEKLRRMLGLPSRADFVEESSTTLALIEAAANDLNYRHRRDALDDAIASLRFVHRRGPLPACSQLENPLSPKNSSGGEQQTLL